MSILAAIHHVDYDGVSAATVIASGVLLFVMLLLWESPPSVWLRNRFDEDILAVILLLSPFLGLLIFAFVWNVFH